MEHDADMAKTGETDMKFTPRHISQDLAEQGYNNAGRGELIGYIAVPEQHEKKCRYRVSTGGDPDKQPHEMCTCRIGLWKEQKRAKKSSKPKTGRKKK